MSPLIGLAVQMLPDLLGAALGSTSTRDAIENVVGRVIKEVTGTGDPAVAKEAMQADPAVAAEVKHRLEVETAEFRLQVEDAQSARAQTAMLVQSGSPMAWGAVVMSALAVVGFYGFLGAILLVPMDSAAREVVMLLGGAIIGTYTSAVSYWLGSSAGSKTKDESIRGILRQTVSPTGAQVAASVAKAAAGKAAGR